MVTQTFATREEWLAAAVELMRPLFALHGATIPANVKVFCIPLAQRSGRVSTTMAQAGWPDENGQIELVISPQISEAAEVAHILAHELVHAAVGNDKGHGRAFRKLALAIGLIGAGKDKVTKDLEIVPTVTMTSTAAGDDFKAWWTANGISLGVYPSGPEAPKKPAKPQLIELYCEACLTELTEMYTVHISGKMLKRGAPLCPIHNKPMEER
jgi:hypothetical protein